LPARHRNLTTEVEKRPRVIYPFKRSRELDGARAHTNPSPLKQYRQGY